LRELLFRELRLERLHQARSRLSGGVGDDVELDRRGHRREASALPMMPSSFWIASTKRDRGPEAGIKASLATPTTGGCAGFAGTTVQHRRKGHYWLETSASPGFSSKRLNLHLSLFLG